MTPSSTASPTPAQSALRRWLPIVPLAAAGLSLVRWLLQGTGNVYSKVDLRLYVPDDDLGWRRTSATFAWIGLDLVLVFSLVALGLFLIGSFLIKKWRWLDWPHRIGLALGVLTLLPPLAALTTGLPGEGARETRPGLGIEAPSEGIRASLPGLPAGTYELVPHEENAIRATLIAGGEAFEARFAGDLQGRWVADPSDLTQPMQAEVSVATRSIDTGIELRNKHALEDLKPERFPRISFALREIRGTEPGESQAQDQGRPTKVKFAALGEATLGDRKHEVEVTGTIAALDAEGAKRLQLKSEPGLLLVQAGFSLDLRETIVGNEGTFDKNEIPITTTLVLRHRPKTTK